MKRRPSASTDDDAESSLESDNPNPDPDTRFSGFASRSSPAQSTRLSGLNWKHGDGHNGLPSATHNMSSPALPSSSLTAQSKEESYAKTAPKSRRNAWSIPILVLIASTLGMSLLYAILQSLVSRQPDPKGCRMSYMRPSYVSFTEFDTEHTRFATKYSLYMYREQGVDQDTKVRSAFQLLPRHSSIKDPY